MDRTSVGEPAEAQQRGGVAGARHRVPLVGDAAGRQQQREVGVGRLGRARRAASGRSARGRRAVGKRRSLVQARACRRASPTACAGHGHCTPPSRRRRSCETPLRSHGRPAVQAANSSKTAAASGQANALAVAEVARERRRRSPSPACASPGGATRPAHEPDAPLGARHRALLLRPGGGRQDGVGERRGLGRVVRVLHDDELGALERGAGALAVGQRDERVGRHDPDGLDRARSRARRTARPRAAPAVGEIRRRATPQCAAIAARSPASATLR